MSYTWIEPKTDWTYRDKFTYTDYNRIRNNMLYINERINELFPELYVELDLGEPKTFYDEEYFPSEFNAFEDALISFERTGENYNLGLRYYHYDNDPFVWEDVLNRLESCLLRWKRIDNIPVQSIRLVPHGDEHTLMFIGDSALYDIIIEPSNATRRNSWVLDNDNDIYVSKYLTCEKIADTQVRVTYTKGRGENAYSNGTSAPEKLFMVEDKTSLTDANGYNCSESIYENYIRVKVENLKAKSSCKYLAQGSYINRKEDNGKNTRQYYKFTKIADNVDGRGITTFQMTLSDIYAMPWGYENRADANTPWRKAFDGVHFWSFSKNLRDSMQSVQKEVMSSATAKTNSSSKFHLPSFKEFGSDNSNVLSLSSLYPYLSSNEMSYNGNSLGIERDNYDSCNNVVTRSQYDASSLDEEGLSSDNKKALLSSRTSYIESYKPSCASGIFPLIFLPSDLSVTEYVGGYKIDWSGESDLTLAEIPLGSIVFDSDGNKGDYSNYEHISQITLNKTSISMNETAVQTITISAYPLSAVNVQKLNVYTDNPKSIGLDYSGNTITVTGLKMGIGHIYVEADEFPEEVILAVCNISVTQPQIQTARINPASGWGGGIGDTLDFSVIVTPSGLDYTVEWSSSNTSLLTIDENGRATMIAEGTVTVTAIVKQRNHDDIVLTSTGAIVRPCFQEFNLPYSSVVGYAVHGVCVAPSYDKENSPMVLHIATNESNNHYYFNDDNNEFTQSINIPPNSSSISSRGSELAYININNENDNIGMLSIGSTLVPSGNAYRNVYELKKRENNTPYWTSLGLLEFIATSRQPQTVSVKVGSTNYIYVFGHYNLTRYSGSNRIPLRGRILRNINSISSQGLDYFTGKSSGLQDFQSVTVHNNEIYGLTVDGKLQKVTINADGTTTAITIHNVPINNNRFSTTNPCYGFIASCRGNLYYIASSYLDSSNHFVQDNKYYKYNFSTDNFEIVGMLDTDMTSFNYKSNISVVYHDYIYYFRGTKMYKILNY